MKWFDIVSNIIDIVFDIGFVIFIYVRSNHCI